VTLRQGLAFFLGFVVLFVGGNAAWNTLHGEATDLSRAMIVRALAIGAIATVVQSYLLRKRST